MDLRFVFALLGFLALNLTTRAGAADPAPRADERAGEKKAVGKPALAKGMTAEQIMRIVGKPEEVRPMKTTGPKAEVWIYRRLLERRTQHTATGVEHRPAFVGGLANEGTVMHPEFRLEHVTSYQVTWVLLIEGRLEQARQTKEVVRSFD